METVARLTSYTSAVRAEELTYKYADGTVALTGLTFEAAPARITAILGPNGAGKSTAFKILSTQLAPESGEAWIDSHSVRDDAARARASLGVTFQSPSLDPWLTVDENLRLHGTLYGLASDVVDKRIGELCALFGLNDKRDARVKGLSGGLARRAELAKTLLPGPRVLLLDEPTTGLDPLARRLFWAELRKLREAGLSLVVTTHLMDEADLCDDILILSHGRLAASGTPAELKARVGGDVVEADFDGDPDQPHELQAIVDDPANKARLDGSHLRVEAADPERMVGRVRRALGASLRHLRLGPPTLADVYFTVTGEALA